MTWFRSESRDQEPLAAGTRALALSAVAGLAIGICLHYGRRGIMPLDQAIVFDGGWRLVSGQLPFRDFTTPAGVVPSVMQALLFASGGVNWFVYCLHAAIVNALFAWIAFRIMRECAAGFWMSWLIAAGTTVVFYPPFGVPYADQHSFFFAAACLWTTLVSGLRGRWWAWWLTPLFAVLALFSKPVPALFVVVPCVFALAPVGWLRHRRSWAAGLTVPALVAAVAVALVRPRWDLLFYYLVTLPAQAAAARPGFWDRLDHVWRDWQEVALVTPWMTIALWVGVGAVSLTRRLPGRTSRRGRRAVACAGLSVGLFLVTAAFTFVTNNDVTNAVAFWWLIVGLAWLGAAALFDGLDTSGRAWRAGRLTLAALVLVAGAMDLWRFNAMVNAPRGIQAGFDASLPRWSPGGRLGFLLLNDAADPRDPRAALAYIDDRGDNFLQLGDSSFLYGATGRPSLFPALWFHPGLTIPPPGTPEFADLEERLVRNVVRQDARYVLQEGDFTLLGSVVEDFPRLSALVDGCPEERIGGWTVREICRPAG